MSWECPRCFIKIGQDYKVCPMCDKKGFRKEYLPEADLKVDNQIMGLFLSETKGKKIGNTGKHKKNSSGFHTIDPYLGHRSPTNKK